MQGIKKYIFLLEFMCSCEVLDSSNSRKILLFVLKRFLIQFISFISRFFKSETSLNFSTFHLHGFVKPEILTVMSSL